MKRTFFLIILVTSCFFLARATDYYVDATIGNNANDGSSGSPWKTITYALSQITGSGHTVYVAAGTYDTTLGETFPILMKNGVSLVGAGMDVSIIDANSTNTVIQCISIVDASTRAEGFTIKGGGSNRGFLISAGSALKIVNNKITENGDGLYLENSPTTIINNTINGNSGIGIYISNSSPFIKGNRITENTGGNGLYITGSSSLPRIVNNVIAKNSGYGIDCYSSSQPKIINNTISENANDGIYISSASPDTILNNIISLNSGYGIKEDGTTSDPGKVWYNLFYANTSGLYCDEGTTDYYTALSLNTGVAECENNIDGDPMFVDKANGDYHLKLGSPAIDAGDPTFEYSNEPSPNGERINIGAYGNTTEATTSTTIASLPESIYVDAVSGSNSTGDGTSGNPWQTITYTLNQITGTGHTLYVAAGTYDPTLGETFPILMKNGVSLIGAGIDISIIDANSINRVIQCVGIVDPLTGIEGFTVTGGGAQYGGGLFISGGSVLKIADNKISTNSATDKGGGLYVTNSTVILINNTITSNSISENFGYGGGLYLTDATATIADNTINDNYGSAAWATAAGLYLSNSTATITNNNITNNDPGTFGTVGGLYLSGCSAIITNNTISGNQTYNGSGYDYGSGIYILNSSPLIQGNVITQNLQAANCIYISGSISSPRIVNNLIAKNSGDGITCRSSSVPSIINNTISDNTSDGIYISSASPDSILNNIISLNSGFGISEADLSSDPGKVSYNLFYANSSGLYHDEGTTDYYTAGTLNTGVAECENNIEGDPMFVDRVNSDYNLSLGSPAIDAGDPDPFFNDPDGSRNDIGALAFDSPPAAPQNLSATAGAEKITLRWNPNTEPDLDQYNIYRDLSSPPSTLIDSVISTSPPDTFYVDTGLIVGQDYYYRIKAKDAAGKKSDFSGEAMGTPITGLQQDSLALVALYNSTDGANWTNNTNWLAGNVSTWYGITASGNRVTEILLDSNNLNGTILPEVGNLTNLLTLQLDHNQLSGSIPKEIGNLTNLIDISLWENQLTGPIPSEIGNLTSLTKLDLDVNLLTGDLPSEIGNLVNLEEFWSCKNQLTGSIPSSIGNLTNLTVLSIWENQLTGIIPTEIGNLVNLTNLSLSSNLLTGMIPPEIGNLSKLDYLGLTSNQLTNSIPIEIGNIDSLKTLALGGNQLSGSIPTELQNLNKLTKLYLWGNQLTGSIPPEIGNLVNLMNLQLSSNLLTGTIPPEFGNLVNLEVLYLWGNQLTGAIPTELGNLSDLTNLSLLDNQLSGSIPTEIGNLTSLESLYLNDNQFTDLPDLSSLVSLDDLQIQNNQFTFKDIEPNIGIASTTYIYSPQDSIGEIIDTTVYVETNFTLLVSTGGDNSQYQWKKDGTNIGTVSGDSTYTINPVAFSDSGTYRCEITNTVATELTLYSRPINVFVDYTPLQKDSLALVALYDSTAGANWTNNTNWLTGNVSTWYGITVSNDRVTQISLESNNLAGTISPEIGNLTNLTWLRLVDNQLTGSIPMELTNLINLQFLHLTDNQLSGTIPSGIGNMINLHDFEVGSNSFTGSIPTTIGNLTDLVKLSVGYNQLTGIIPSEIGNLTNLENLGLASNQLSGSIPPEIGNLTNLIYLDFNINQLSGSIPIEIGNLINLQNLNFEDNQLSGSIPTQIGNLTNLVSLNLELNQLTEAIPSEIGNLTNLTYLNLKINNLTGSVPTEIGSLTNLQFLYLHDNQLTGSIPTEIGNLTYLIRLVLYNNQFTDMPNLASLDSLDDLQIQNNQFTFEDIEPNIGVANTTFTYSPQDSVGETIDTTVFIGTSYTLSVSTGGASSQYQWKKDEVNIGTVSGDSTYMINPVAFSDSGTYTCEITNTVATDLTLYSRPVNVSVEYPPIYQDSLALVALYDSTDGANWTNNTNWLTGNVSTWYGITVSGDRVSQISLHSNNLIGTIPPEIGNLINLYSLCLSNNQLSGSILPEIGNLANLQNLDFQNNQLSGSIPTEIGDLTNLTFIDFNDNQLTGPIPVEIGNLSNLNTLNLHYNQLSGSIPTEIVNLTYLRELKIYINQFTGLPNLSTLDSLDDLRIENNKFTFEDIEPNIGVPDSTFTYSPQDSIGEIIDTTVYIGTSFKLSVSTGGTSSQYQWKKDGTNIGTVSGDSTYTISPVALSDSGTYTCEITNTIATDLTLYSRPVHVSVPSVLSSENDILSFSFSEQTGPADINNTDHTISVEVVSGTNLANLVATFSISSQASIAINSVDQVSGVTANNFTNPVTYTVTAENGTPQDWIVNVSEAGISVISDFPYSEDFNSGNGGWRTGGANSSWQLGNPAGPTINSATSGSAAWVTNLAGDYNQNEVSYVTSPRFDLSGINYPKIEFNIWWDAEGFYDGANFQYKQGTGVWKTLGTNEGENNWYNSSYIYSIENGFGFDMNNSAGWSGDDEWGYGSNGWVTVEHALTEIDYQSAYISFRIGFASNSTYENDGVAIDDINIFDDPTGIDDINTLMSDIQIYPNPNEGKFRLVYNGERDVNLILQLINLQGQVILSEQIETGDRFSKEFELDYLAAGIYYFRLLHKEGVIVKKMVVK